MYRPEFGKGPWWIADPQSLAAYKPEPPRQEASAKPEDTNRSRLPALPIGSIRTERHDAAMPSASVRSVAPSQVQSRQTSRAPSVQSTARSQVSSVGTGYSSLPSRSASQASSQGSRRSIRQQQRFASHSNNLVCELLNTIISDQNR